MPADVTVAGDRIVLHVSGTLSFSEASRLAERLWRLSIRDKVHVSVKDFAEIHAGQLPREWTAASDLMALYKRWCARRGVEPVGVGRFASSLKGLGIPYRRDQKRRRYRL